MESLTGRWAEDGVPIQTYPVPKRMEPFPRKIILNFDFSAVERRINYQSECELIRSLVQEIDHHARRYARAKRVVRRAVRRLPSTSRHFLLRNTNIFTLS